VAIGLCALESRYLTHATDALEKTRDGAVMKAVPLAERPSSVSMLYKTLPAKMMNPKHGLLVIDDVYDSGSTLEEVCRALQAEYPEIPKYVITLTHLWRSL
jgi:predicted amidophosphoribosyltransferase